MDKFKANYEFPQMKYPERKGLVSIIVPIYNSNEAHLMECLDSILAQTFANWEAILVNDCSTDNNTGRIIDKYAEKDSRFITVHKPQNEGLLLARKTGLENSKGEFIANLDHDDKYYTQFLEKMHAKITETNADFAWCKRGGKHGIQATDYEWDVDASKNIAVMLQWHVSLLIWDKLIKREIYLKVRFPDIHLVIAEDIVQVIQVAYYSKSAVFVPEILHFHRPGGATAFFSSKLIPTIKSIIITKELLEMFFNGMLPQNLKKIFYSRYQADALYYYYLLDKKMRMQFKNELEPTLLEAMKQEKKLGMKICLFLASRGIEFPIKLRELAKKLAKWR